MDTFAMIALADTGTLTLLSGVAIFLAITLILVIVLLIAKKFLVHSGEVRININNDKDVFAMSGKTLLSTLGDQNIFLSSACGGKGSCGQCKVQVFEGGGDILPTETVHFSRKQMKDHWRLGCQVKVKEDMAIGVPASVLDVKEWECEVISNKNVATFIKEFIVALPPGEHMNFIPGSYAQIKIPAYEMDYNTDIDKSLIGDEYLPAWEKFGLFTLKCKNTEPTIRLLHGQLSCRGRPHNAYRTHSHSAFQTETRSRISGCHAGYSVILHIHPQARRQGDNEWTLR